MRYLSCLVSLGVALLFPAAVQSGPLTTPLPPVPVTVTNTAVPVTGTVGIVGQPTVKLASPVATVAADDPARNAFQVGLQQGQCFQVPAGKRAVIEFASGSLSLNPFMSLSDVGAMPALSTTVGGIGALHVIPGPVIRFEATSNGSTSSSRPSLVAGSTPMRAYADASSGVCAQVVGSSVFVTGMSVWISGHLVDMP